jgi:hypothetical protein
MPKEIRMPNTETSPVAVLRKWRRSHTRPAHSVLGLRASFGFRISDFGLRAGTTPKDASILVGLLWCLALLSVVVIGVLHTARMDLLVVKNHGDRIQAHYLALAGIEKAKRAALSRCATTAAAARRTTPAVFMMTRRTVSRRSQFGRGTFLAFIRRGRTDEGGGHYFWRERRGKPAQREHGLGG